MIKWATMTSVRYTLSMPEPGTHLFHVRVEVKDVDSLRRAVRAGLAEKRAAVEPAR